MSMNNHRQEREFFPYRRCLQVSVTVTMDLATVVVLFIKPRNISDAEASERKFDEDQGVYMDTESLPTALSNYTEEKSNLPRRHLTTPS